MILDKRMGPSLASGPSTNDPREAHGAFPLQMIPDKPVIYGPLQMILDKRMGPSLASGPSTNDPR